MSLQLGQRTSQPLVLGPLHVEVVLHRLECRLRFLLDFLGGHARRRPGGRVQPPNELLDLVRCAGRALFYPARGGVESVAKVAEMLYKRLGLAGQQPAEQGGRFLCGVVAEFHRVWLIWSGLHGLQP